MDTLDRVRRTLVEALNLDSKPESLDPEAPLFGEGLGLDSIDGLEIVVALEREFDVIIEDTEMGPNIFENLHVMCQFLELKMAGESKKGARGDRDGED